ncbi:MAG TPA: lycopene cyclase domain-containing protein [Acidimicrobiia bacterium]|jgi:lycopene cyclase domain-containing protein
MWEYTAVALVVVAGVVLLELRVLRTGLLRTRAYWIALGICFGFMIAVNGWLTKLSAPVVLYDADATTGWRFPWDIPVEDYLFGFALLTLVMVLWEAAAPKRPDVVDVSVTEVTVPSRPREPATGTPS